MVISVACLRCRGLGFSSHGVRELFECLRCQVINDDCGAIARFRRRGSELHGACVCARARACMRVRVCVRATPLGMDAHARAPTHVQARVHACEQGRDQRACLNSRFTRRQHAKLRIVHPEMFVCPPREPP